jgi:putative colanic acid biosynthesis acetyltransferase WcaF
MQNRSDYISASEQVLSFKSRLARFIWNFIWFLFARPIPRRMLNGWKLSLLRIFGARIERHAVVYSDARVYMPWNLELAEYSILGSEVDCYNVDKIKIGPHVVISQKTYLCAASHDISKPDMPLITAPIIIEEQAWIAADAFIGMGVTIGKGAVVGARASVFKDVEPWTIVGGNPAKYIKTRIIDHEN